MDEVRQAIQNYRDLITEHRLNIYELRKAIRGEKDKRTKLAYRKTLRWNKQQIRECRGIINNLRLRLPTSWTWVIMILAVIILALLFPISIWTFAPIWVILLIGFLYILILTGKSRGLHDQ